MMMFRRYRARLLLVVSLLLVGIPVIPHHHHHRHWDECSLVPCADSDCLAEGSLNVPDSPGHSHTGNGCAGGCAAQFRCPSPPASLVQLLPYGLPVAFLCDIAFLFSVLETGVSIQNFAYTETIPLEPVLGNCALRAPPVV